MNAHAVRLAQTMASPPAFVSCPPPVAIARIRSAVQSPPPGPQMFSFRSGVGSISGRAKLMYTSNAAAGVDGRGVVVLGDQITVVHAELRVVAGVSGDDADLRLAEELRVVGHGREVERPAQLRHASEVERWQRHGGALGELVGVPWARRYAEQDRVEGVRGVDVQIADVGIALWVEVGTLRVRRLAGGQHEREQNV